MFKEFTAVFNRMLNVVTVLMLSAKSTIVIELNHHSFLQVMVTKLASNPIVDCCVLGVRKSHVRMNWCVKFYQL